MKMLKLQKPMKKLMAAGMVVSGILFATSISAYNVNNWWPDGDNIVMDDILLPAATWSTPAQSQMTEWNQVDVTDNSHAFRINNNPQFTFGANDGDNSIGFLGGVGLNSEYGLSYANALAWAVCWTPLFSSRYDECDVLLNPALSWSLGPNNNTWFQSTILHELGHVRGLGHYNSFQSIENSGQSKYLRNEILYMDDKVGVRQNASHVSERDVVMYNKWHNGSTPQWMTMSPTTLREGQTIQLNNITVENRGTLAFNSTLRFGIYFSTNNFISTGDQLLNTGSFGSFGTFTHSTFNWSAVIPTVNDCGTRWIGGIIDDNNVWSERFENNNNVTFTNGVAFTGQTFTPTPLSILLAQDTYEQNDTLNTAANITLPFTTGFFTPSVNIDADLENDYYRFIVSVPGTVNITATFTDSLGNINLRLLNSVGSTLSSSLSTTDNESITRHIQPGTYFIRSYGVGTGSCNKYSLSATFDPDDITPPTPNPMTWATVPFELNTSQLRMVATTATDADTPPVNYFFDFTSSPTGGSGGNDLGWTTSRTYTDSGLGVNENYCYRVRARDSAPALNATNYSSISCDYTAARIPGAAVFSNVTQTSIRANWTTNGNPSSSPATRYFVQNTTTGDNSGWITSTLWNNTGLTCNTTYAYRVKARNGDGAETAWRSLGTQATSPCASMCNGDFGGDGDVDGSDLGLFNTDFGRTNCSGASPCNGDFDNDGDVDGTDLGLFNADFGRTDCPIP